MTTASDIAKYIISRFQDSEEPITNMKIQKLLYYVQGWHLGLYNIPAFTQELQAWVHGPVQHDVYREYQEYSWNPISDTVIAPVLDEKIIKHIEEVLECYGGESAYTLEHMTHKEWPWIEARDDLSPNQRSNNIISLSTMKEYFSGCAKNNEEQHNYTLNQETIKVLEQSQRGIGINKSSSLEEMFKQINQELKAECLNLSNV